MKLDRAKAPAPLLQNLRKNPIFPVFHHTFQHKTKRHSPDFSDKKLSEFVALNDVSLLRNPLRVKHADIHFLQEDTKQIKRAKEYFSSLRKSGIFRDFFLSGFHFSHEIKDQKSGLLSVTTPYTPGKNFLVNISTTEKKFHKAFSEQFFQRSDASSNFHVNTFTGMCFFGSGVDTAVLQNGEKIPVVEIGDSLGEIPKKKIVAIHVSSEHSLYEIEKIYRISSFLNALKLSAGKLYQNAYLGTPKVQYYLYLMPAYDAGMISQEAFLKWIKMVKKREIQNYESLQKRLNLPLLKIPSSLAAAEKYIVQSVHKGTKVRFSTVLDMLKKEGQGWRKTLSENTPQNWAQLRLLSYVVLFMNHVEDSAHRNIMTVAVDDLCEKVIANQYARLKKQLQKNGHVTHPALGLYLSQNIFRTCPNEDSALYRPQKYDLPEVFQLIQSEYPNVTVSAYEEKSFFCIDQPEKSGIFIKKR